jgi:hypothetical protein
MRTQLSLLVVPALVWGAACRPTTTVNTLPAPVSPSTAVQYYDLEVPRDLAVKGVDFAATTFSDVFGPPDGTTTSTVSGRAFVKVYAVHRMTGEQFLLLYEDITHRTRPVQIIRFVAGSDKTRPDSTR